VSVGHRFRSSCGELSRREPCLIYFWSDSVSRCRLPFFADDLDQPPHFSGSAHGYAHEAATHVLAPVAKQNSLSLQFAKQRRPSRAKIGQQKIARTRVGLDAKPTKFFRYPHAQRSEEHTSELQSPDHLVCRLLLEKKKKQYTTHEQKANSEH